MSTVVAGLVLAAAVVVVLRLRRRRALALHEGADAGPLLPRSSDALFSRDPFSGRRTRVEF